MATSDAGETAEQKAEKLRQAAAAMRAQANELEEKQKRERREGADRSFTVFDSNKDGAVGIAELRAGLEGPLKKTFTSQLAARMGRKPTAEEVMILGTMCATTAEGVDLYRRLVGHKLPNSTDAPAYPLCIERLALVQTVADASVS